MTSIQLVNPQSDTRSNYLWPLKSTAGDASKSIVIQTGFSLQLISNSRISSNICDPFSNHWHEIWRRVHRFILTEAQLDQLALLRQFANHLAGCRWCLAESRNPWRFTWINSTGRLPALFCKFRVHVTIGVTGLTSTESSSTKPVLTWGIFHNCISELIIKLFRGHRYVWRPHISDRSSWML